MAKGNLDQIVRALVGVDANHLGVVRDISNRLNSPDAPRWHNRFTDVLQEGLPELEPPPPLLVFDDEHIATVDLSEPHDPASFWRDTDESPARYVWGGFQTNVVALAQPLGPLGIVTMRYAPVARNTTVRAILDAPGVGNHSPSILSAFLATAIKKQPNGEVGILRTDGLADLFPCGSVLVHVYWYDVRRRWRVVGWSPGCGVLAGRRVFSGDLKI